MTAREIVLEAMRNLGRGDALSLRGRAADMDGTAIIAEEFKAPPFDPGKDYTAWPRGAPVTDEGQVWTLLQPHNAAHYEGRPSGLRALWGLCHTTDPARAKPFVAPYGTSGIYKRGECVREENGVVYRLTAEETDHRPADYPQGWEIVSESDT